MKMAARRAADVLLQGAGRGVLLRVPAAATQGDVGEQLGLAAPEFQDVPLGPVVFRKARATVSAGKGARWELMVSAAAVDALVGATGFDAADAMFAGAQGVMVDEELMEIVLATRSTCGDEVYVHRLVVEEPLRDVV